LVVGKQGAGMTKYADWPGWLKFVVLAPNGALLWFIAYPWFPKTKRQWIWTGVAIAYLAAFFSIMHYVFGL
jgi:hypothetical protein